MTKVQQRTYTPTPDDLGPCMACGEVTLPFPHQDSGRCSWCFFLDIIQHRNTALPE